jgi:LL-diaminopimelate aminotransferase
MEIRVAERIATLPPYLFAELDRKKAEARRRGLDLISLGIGDPDLPTPGHIVSAGQAALADPTNHRYPDYEGLREFREACLRFYDRRFGVQGLDPDRHCVSLIGSKEGIAHVALALVDPGDVVLCPAPGYPVYGIGTRFAGGVPYYLPLHRENGFLPDLDAIPPEVLRRARVLWLNYPNNPTGAVADREFYRRVVAFAEEHGIVVLSDNAYSELAFDGYRAPSFLETPGALEVGAEFHSLSKTYNMTGWRLGFAVGNPTVIAALGQVKTNVDSGVFQGVQRAGIAALDGDQACVAEACEVYRRRRDVLVSGLRAAGWEAEPMRATFYLWVPTPRGLPSMEVVTRLLDEAGVVATPGVGFGPGPGEGGYGEGYVRFALTVSEERIREAVARIGRLSF